MARRINISQARGKLPELAKFLMQYPDQVVLVEHRDLEKRLALTTEDHIRYLETTAKELRKEASRPFKLAGSITSKLSDGELEAALKQMRKEQERLRAKKVRQLAS